MIAVEITLDRVEKIKKHIGVKQFFTIKDLLALGLYGSKESASLAMRQEIIPTVRISERRRVVMREDLLKLLEKKYSK